MKNINISLSADAASPASRSWEGVWEAWETGGDSPCPGARLPQRCCQPDGEIGAETPPGTRRAAPALLGTGGDGGGAWDPCPHSHQPRRLSRGTSRCSLMDEPEALPESSSQGKQLLGRNLIRAGLGGRSSFCLWFIPALQNHSQGWGIKAGCKCLGRLCLETPLAKGSASRVCLSLCSGAAPRLPPDSRSGSRPKQGGETLGLCPLATSSPAASWVDTVPGGSKHSPRQK